MVGFGVAGVGVGLVGVQVPLLAFGTGGLMVFSMSSWILS